MDKLCLDCRQPIIGRADKKFCDDACRSTYNNRMHSNETAYLRKINHKLKQNRKILKALNPEGKVKIEAKALRDQGFDLNYFTSIYVTQKGNQYRYCYEYGYLLLDNDQVLLVKRQYG